MGLDDVLVLWLLKHLQQNSKIGGEKQKVVGSLVERVESSLDFCPQLDEDVQCGKNVRDRHGDSVAEVAFRRLVICPVVTAGVTQQPTYL